MSRHTGVKMAAAAGLGLAVIHGAHPGHHHHHGGHAEDVAAVRYHGGSNTGLGKRMAAAHGWTGGQWTCLYLLWERESGWSNTAENARSGAYGIAQALGHGPTNQYPAGPANPPASSARAQIRWGLGYIGARYGTPCGAEAHETRFSWY